MNSMDFHYTLLENGLDFVRSSLEHLTAASATGALEIGGQKRHLKYALTHLCSGVELVFKERIRLYDWQLLFRYPEKATVEAYLSGDFESITFKNAQDQLEKECRVRFTDEEKKRLLDFRKHRNRVEHFDVACNTLAMQSRITQMINYLVSFVAWNFQADELEKKSRKC